MTGELHPADLDRLKAALAVLPPRPLKLSAEASERLAEAVVERLRSEALDAGPVIAELRAAVEEARGLVGLLRPVAEAQWLEAKDVAVLLNVSRDYVYRNAKALGGVRLQTGKDHAGPNQPLRFSRVEIERRLREGVPT